MTVDTPWFLRNIPPESSIVFNLRTDEILEWNAQALAKYKQDVLGW